MNVSEKPLPRLKKRTLSPKQTQLRNFAIGDLGEKRAVEFLQKKNFLVIDRNIQCGPQEIDIIAIDQDVDELVFIEVKTRSEAFYGDPSTAVGWKKRSALRKGALAYLKGKKLNKDFRFDIIAVLPNSIEHYENLTW